MSLRFALLGLLRLEPASGYELTQSFAESIGRYAWTAKHSQIYPELKKLEAEELIEVVAEGARGRRTYGLTDSGYEALHAWLQDATATSGAVRNEFVLRMFLLSALPSHEAIQLLTHLIAYVDEQIDDLSRQFDAIVSDDRLGMQGGGYAAALGIYQYRSLRDWANWAINELRMESTPGHTPTLDR